MAKVKALRNKMERERSSNSLLHKAIGENHRNPSKKARIQTSKRLLLEDLISIAESDFIELRNGKVSEYEAMSPIDYKRRPGEMFNAGEMQQLYDASGCSVCSRLTSPCTNRLAVYMYHTIDGTCNNLKHSDYGAATTELRRSTPPTYENEINTPTGFSQTVCNSPNDSAPIDDNRGGAYCYGNGKENCLEEDYLYDDFLFENSASRDPCHNVPGAFDPPLPSPHYVAARIVLHKKPFTLPYSDLLLLWGKFVLNDIVNVPDIGGDSAPLCDDCEFSDVCYSIRVSGNNRNVSDCLPMRRSVIGCCHDDIGVYLPRQQLNDVTAFLDASVVYGSHKERSNKLRSFDKGRLKSVHSEGLDKLPVADSNDIHCVNSIQDTKNVYMCGDYCCVDGDPMTYIHTLFLRFHNSIAMGLNELNSHWTDELVYQETRKIVGAIMQKITYQDYLPKIFTGDYFDAFVQQYRMYNDTLHPQLDTEFSDVVFAGVYFPNYYHRGVVKQKDAMSLIIQRAREHGLSSYATLRKYIEEKYPLLPQPTLKDVSKLEKIYGSLNNVDLVVGALGEQQLMTFLNSSAMFGHTFAVILGEAFKNIRNGDRFFYQRRGIFTAEQFEQIDGLTFSSIICEHDDKVGTMSQDAFFKNYDNTDCRSIPTLDLTPWKDDACYIKVSSRTTLSAGQVISVSHVAGTPFLKVYTNKQQLPSCLPIKCPTENSLHVRLYSFLNIKQHTDCTVSSLHPYSQFVKDGLFLNVTVEYSMVDDLMIHRTLMSCDGASRSFVEWECLENAEFLLEDPNNPDSTLTLPLGLNFLKL